MNEGTATLERPETERENFFTPATAKEFQQFVDSELRDRLVEVDEKEVTSQRILWRGHDPHEVVGLLDGKLDDIRLVATQPNVTLDWHKAIAYNRGGEDIHYNAAIGFVPPDTWSSRPALADVPEDLQHYDDVTLYQQGNFIANGTLHRENLRYLIVRPHGGKGKEPEPPKFFRIAA